MMLHDNTLSAAEDACTSPSFQSGEALLRSVCKNVYPKPASPAGERLFCTFANFSF